MKAAWRTKVLFWTATCAACVWLLVATAIGAAGIFHFFAAGFGASGRRTGEIFIVTVLVVQPVVILLLLIRAIRLRGTGRPPRIIARAFYPLLPALLFAADFRAIRYLNIQAYVRMAQRRSTGSITYACSTVSRTVDYHPKTIGPTELRLTEFRHPGKMSTWIVAWPGRKPIKATSFRARTHSIGGSQGIKWREPDGRPMIAYLSFSDLVTMYGPAGMWVALVQSDAPESEVRIDTLRSGTHFTCGPDPASYHE